MELSGHSEHFSFSKTFGFLFPFLPSSSSRSCEIGPRTWIRVCFRYSTSSYNGKIANVSKNLKDFQKVKKIKISGYFSHSWYSRSGHDLQIQTPIPAIYTIPWFFCKTNRKYFSTCKYKQKRNSCLSMIYQMLYRDSRFVKYRYAHIICCI